MATSTSGGIFHELFYLYLAIALLVGGLIIGWLAYILIKYRAHPGMERPRDAPRAGILPAERGHPIWSYVMAIVIAGIMFGLAFGTISATHTLEEPPEEGFRVEATVWGSQFSWSLTYEGEGGVPLERIQDWTIPVNTPIVADVKSKDVWHNFALPEYRIRIDVIPGQTNHIWWQATELGEVAPVCVQLCGAGHANMRTNMHVVTMDAWKEYVAAESAAEYASLAKRGQIVNATYDGVGFTLDERDARFNATRPFALQVTNLAGNVESFELGLGEKRADGFYAMEPRPEGPLTIASGAHGFVYAGAIEGEFSRILRASTTGAQIEMPAVI